MDIIAFKNACRNFFPLKAFSPLIRIKILKRRETLPAGPGPILCDGARIFIRFNYIQGLLNTTPNGARKASH